MLRKPRPRLGERTLGAAQVTLLEARREQTADLSEARTCIAGDIAEKHPDGAEDLVDLGEIPIARGREEDGDAADERADHVSEPVIDGPSERVELVRRAFDRRQLADEALDLSRHGILMTCARDAPKGQESGLESEGAVHLRCILHIRSVDQARVPGVVAPISRDESRAVFIGVSRRAR